MHAARSSRTHRRKEEDDTSSNDANPSIHNHHCITNHQQIANDPDLQAERRCLITSNCTHRKPTTMQPTNTLSPQLGMRHSTLEIEDRLRQLLAESGVRCDEIGDQHENIPVTGLELALIAEPSSSTNVVSSRIDQFDSSGRSERSEEAIGRDLGFLNSAYGADIADPRRHHTVDYPTSRDMVPPMLLATQSLPQKLAMKCDSFTPTYSISNTARDNNGITNRSLATLTDRSLEPSRLGTINHMMSKSLHSDHSSNTTLPPDSTPCDNMTFPSLSLMAPEQRSASLKRRRDSGYAISGTDIASRNGTDSRTGMRVDEWNPHMPKMRRCSTPISPQSEHRLALSLLTGSDGMSGRLYSDDSLSNPNNNTDFNNAFDWTTSNGVLGPELPLPVDSRFDNPIYDNSIEGQLNALLREANNINSDFNDSLLDSCETGLEDDNIVVAEEHRLPSIEDAFTNLRARIDWMGPGNATSELSIPSQPVSADLPLHRDAIVESSMDRTWNITATGSSFVPDEDDVSVDTLLQNLSDAVSMAAQSKEQFQRSSVLRQLNDSQINDSSSRRNELLLFDNNISSEPNAVQSTTLTGDGGDSINMDASFMQILNMADVKGRLPSLPWTTSTDVDLDSQNPPDYNCNNTHMTRKSHSFVEEAPCTADTTATASTQLNHHNELAGTTGLAFLPDCGSGRWPEPSPSVVHDTKSSTPRQMHICNADEICQLYLARGADQSQLPNIVELLRKQQDTGVGGWKGVTTVVAGINKPEFSSPTLQTNFAMECVGMKCGVGDDGVGREMSMEKLGQLKLLEQIKSILQSSKCIEPPVPMSRQPNTNKSAGQGETQLKSVVTEEVKMARNKCISVSPVMHDKSVTFKPMRCHRSIQADIADDNIHDHMRSQILCFPVPVPCPLPVGEFRRIVLVPMIYPTPIPLPFPVFVPEKKFADMQLEVEASRHDLPVRSLEAKVVLRSRELISRQQQQQQQQQQEDAFNSEKKSIKPEGDVECVDLNTLLGDSLDERVVYRSRITDICDRSLPNGFSNLPSLRRFYQWFASYRTVHLYSDKSAQIPSDLTQFHPHQLGHMLRLFAEKHLSHDDGSCNTESLLSDMIGISCHIKKDLGKNDNLFFDEPYELLADMLHYACCQYQINISAEGKLICRVTEDMMWECGLLGCHSPYSLMSTIFYFNTKYFLQASAEQHGQIGFDSVKLVSEDTVADSIADGIDHADDFFTAQTLTSSSTAKEELDERLPVSCEQCKSYRLRLGEKIGGIVCEQCENQSNPARCPLRLYEFYLSKCPKSAIENRVGHIYLMPEPACLPSSPVWYRNERISVAEMDKMLSRYFSTREILEIHMTANNLLL